MTTIAWDGKTLAADKQATCSGVVCTTTKIRRASDGRVLAWTGDQDSGEMVADWYLMGAERAAWPKCQEDKDAWARLIVAARTGLWVYERQPIPVQIEDPFYAWGSGRDFALAALHLGKSAREAVEIAALFDLATGRGVDIFECPSQGGNEEKA